MSAKASGSASQKFGGAPAPTKPNHDPKDFGAGTPDDARVVPRYAESHYARGGLRFC